MMRSVMGVVALGGLLMCGCDEKADVTMSPDGAFKTPAAAAAEVARLRAAGKIPAGRPAIIDVAAGVYRFAETPELTGLAKGLYFRGPKVGEAVFSGARQMGPFTVGADGIWRAKVSAGVVFEQLWVNGQRAERAKAPNKFYYYVLQPGGGEVVNPKTGYFEDLSRRSFYTTPEAVKELAATPADELKDVAIHVWWAWDAEWQVPVKVDAAKGYVELMHPVGRNFFMWSKWCPRFNVENCRAALDAPGEWFLDRKKGELLYIPRVGEEAATALVEAAVLPEILRVKDGAQDILFERITFAHNAWLLGAGFYAHQSAVKANAAVNVTDAGGILFRNCHVTHTANYGIWFGKGTHDCEVRHSRLDDLGAGAVRIGALSWKTNDAPETVAQRITVDDNIITSGGHVFPAGTGVFLTFAKECHVTHNDISDLYYSGICCGWCWGYAPTPNRDNELSWNHIHHLGKGVLSDMGFIYTLGDSRGTIIAGNHGHDMFSYGYTGSGGTGLYPDEGSRGILWTSNLVHHTKTSALSQHYGRDNYFHNNIFAFSTKPESTVAGRWRWEPHTSIICSNNIFAWSAGHHAMGGGKLSEKGVSDLVFGRNLWWAADGVQSNDFLKGSWEKWRALGKDDGSVLADPLFVDWKAGDWHLKPNSPAFGIGFKEWDYTLAGVRKEDPAWRAAAAAVTPAAYEVAPIPPTNPGRKSSKTGFEIYKPGHFPVSVFQGASSRKHGYVMASTRAHFSGKQALEIRDYPDLKVAYWPHFYQYFKISKETFFLRFVLKCDTKADLHCEWREWNPDAPNGQYYMPFRFQVKDGKFYLHARRADKNGKMPVIAVNIPNFKSDAWGKLEFVVHTPKQGKPTWDFSYTSADGVTHRETDLSYVDAACKLPNWIGFLSFAKEESVSFMDDYEYGNE